jgi:hypothetical protein
MTGIRERMPGARPASARTAMRALRPARTVPALIASLVLLAAGALTAVEVVSALLGHPARLLPYGRAVQWARTTAWQDPWVVAGATALLVVGLLLILIAADPGRPRVVALRTGDPDLVVGVPRRMLAAALRASAAGVDGVRRARAKIRGRRVEVTAMTDLRDTAELTRRVEAAVEDELGRLAPVRRMTVRTRVRGPS